MKKYNPSRSIILSLISASLLLSVTSACQKDDDESKLSNTGFLTSKKWRVIKAEGTINGVIVGGDAREECDKDNITTFTADGKYLVDFGSNHCDGEPSDSGTWEWKNGEKILRMVADGEVKDAEFVRLTDTTFKVTVSEKFDIDHDNDDDDIAATFTYAAI